MTAESRDSLREINQYDDETFPVALFTVDKEKIIPRGCGYLNLHWHEELQLTMVTRGSLRLQVNGAEYFLETGQGIFINRNLLHGSMELTDGGQYISINFPDRLLGFFPGSCMERRWVLPYAGNYAFPVQLFSGGADWEQKILEQIGAAAGLLRPMEQGAEYRIAMMLTEIWYQMISHVEGQIPFPTEGDVRRQERILRMLLFVQNHYGENLRLDEIAASADVSETECCRSFQKIVRMTPTQYLNNYRVSKAMEMLRTTERNVTEIAFAVGFNDANYFIRCFKKNTGMTPNRYRKSLQSESG